MADRTIVWLDCGRSFGPEDLVIMVEAVKQASWVLSSNGVVDDAELRQILAKGVTIAARKGERELYDLTLAACRYWFRSPESKRPAHLRLVEIDPVRSSSRN